VGLYSGALSSVLVLTQVACNISGKENGMGIWCDIQSHLTRPRPLPHPKPRPHIFNTFVPAKHSNQVADSQEQLFSLFFLDSSKYHWPQQVSRSEDEQLRESFSETAKIVSKNTHVCKRFYFSTLYYCTADPPTDRYSMCCSWFVSVALTCPLFLQIGNTLEILGTHDSDKRK